MKNLFLTPLFVLLYAFVLGQTEAESEKRRGVTPIFSESIEKSYTLMHNTAAFKQREHTNEIVSILGELTGHKPSNSFQATLNYTEKIELNRVADKLEVTVSIKNKGVTGKLNAHGFNCAVKILPDQINFRVKVMVNNETVLLEQEKTNVAIPVGFKDGKEVVVFKTTIPYGESEAKLSARVYEISAPQPVLLFSHSASKKGEVKTFQENITLYEKEAASVTANIAAIKNFSYNDPEKLQSQLQEIEKYNQFSQSLLSRNYVKSLSLSKNDPKGLLSNIEQLNTLQHGAKADIQNRLKSLDDLYYQKGMAQLAINDKKGSQTWFNKALEFNPSHIGSNIEMAKFEVGEGKLEAAKQRGEKILAMGPENSTVNEVNALLAGINKQFAEVAVKEYKKIISEAEKMWSLGNRFDGLKKLEEAAQYQKKNNEVIPNNDEAGKVFERFANNLSLDGDKYYRTGNHEEALKQYKDAKKVMGQYLNSYGYNSFFDKKIKVVHTSYLDKLIQVAQLAVNRRDWINAGEAIERVLFYLKQNPEVDEPPLLKSLVTKTQMGMFSDGERLVFRKSYLAGFELLNKCLQFSQNAGMQPPKEIFNLLSEGRNGAFIDMLLTGQKAINQRDIKGAERHLHEAVSFLQNKMSPQAVTALEAYKESLILLYMHEAERYRSLRQFNQALDIYDRAQESQYKYGMRFDRSVASMIMETREEEATYLLDGAEQFIDRKDFKKAIKIISEGSQYIDTHGLAGNSKGKLFLIADRCFRDMLQEADNFNRQKKYNDALSVISDGWYLCRNFAIRCDDDLLVIRERESHTGIYKEKAAKALSLIERGDYSGGSAAAAELVQYREAHPQYLIVGKEEELLMSKLRQRDYQTAISNGRNHFDKGEYALALNFFDDANNLEAKGVVTSDTKLKEIRKTSALKTAMQEADKLEAMVGSGTLVGAKEKMLQIVTMQNTYNLKEDKELSARVKVLQDRIVDAACLEQKKIYESSMEKAYRYAKHREFILAEGEIHKAIEAANKKPECELFDSTATGYLTQLTPAINYQKKYNEATELIENYKNREGVKTYLEAEELFNRGNVKLYGIEHEPFSTYALKQNQNFMLAAAFHYRDVENNEAVFNMLKELAQKGFPAKQTRLLQEQIGYDYGKGDRLKFPASTWKISVLQHTAGDSYWKYFKKAYQKGWKSVN